jgi:flagellar biosynthesis/type III secretory pathway M-ring protein FliF/YscJ
MTTKRKRKSDVELKQDILDQIKSLQDKALDIDKKRADRVGALALKFKVTDLSDDILEQEFKAVYTKYQSNINPTQALDAEVKKYAAD